ncbi:8845_t:CDS:1, partial [Racocetra fulgida]
MKNPATPMRIRATNTPIPIPIFAPNEIESIGSLLSSGFVPYMFDASKVLTH